MSPFAPTERPAEGVVSWNLNTSCNYRCSYCTQRFKDDRGRASRDTPRFLEAFARLPGRWELKLSGGEPFVHPRLDEIVAGLAGLGHRISMVTNFSAPREALARFAEAAAGRVGIFSCSLHLDYVPDLEGFVEKALWMQTLLRERGRPELPAPHLCVTSVATRAALPSLPAIAARLAAAGVSFKVQPEKQGRDVVAYTPEEQQQIERLGGHNLTGRIAHDFEGRPCWAGARYFILDDLGEAHRCYPARRYRREPLGSFLSPAFSLAEAPAPCLYRYCNCTVPIARGMMPRDPGREPAEEDPS